jgi:hypothetical protein
MVHHILATAVELNVKATNLDLYLLTKDIAATLAKL